MSAEVLCGCGCGDPAPIAKKTDWKTGAVKGQPVRFIVGHWSRVRPLKRTVETFWDCVDKSGDCWLWLGSVNSAGYGHMELGRKPNRRTYYAHRLAYELAVGPIPAGLTLDHLCRTRTCVRPDHLEPVTRGENTRRGMSPGAVAVRTNRCKRGHEFTPENTYWQLNGLGRMCRACHAKRQLDYYHQRRRAEKIA